RGRERQSADDIRIASSVAQCFFNLSAGAIQDSNGPGAETEACNRYLSSLSVWRQGQGINRPPLLAPDAPAQWLFRLQAFIGGTADATNLVITGCGQAPAALRKRQGAARPHAPAGFHDELGILAIAAVALRLKPAIGTEPGDAYDQRQRKTRAHE